MYLLDNIRIRAYDTYDNPYNIENWFYLSTSLLVYTTTQIKFYSCLLRIILFISHIKREFWTRG